jgi:hypothetical protein
VPWLSINGTPPSNAAIVVIMIGRKRNSAAWRIASTGVRPSSRSAEIAVPIEGIGVVADVADLAGA